MKRPDPTTWVDDHGDALYRYALMRTRNPTIAEETVQEALLAALKARDRYSGESTERTWLIGILKHKIVDYVRREARRSVQQVPEPADLELDVFRQSGLWKRAPQPWKKLAPSRLDTAEFWASLESCLSKLPQIYADAFWLREVDGMSAEEVCEVLSITATNLWSRVHRARILLRDCMERNWFAKGDGTE